jgi:hypothetical protein
MVPALEGGPGLFGAEEDEVEVLVWYPAVQAAWLLTIGPDRRLVTQVRYQSAHLSRGNFSYIFAAPIDVLVTGEF